MNDESFENLKQLYAGVHAVRKDTIDKLFDLLGTHVDNDVFLQKSIGPVALNRKLNYLETQSTTIATTNGNGYQFQHHDTGQLATTASDSR